MRKWFWSVVMAVVGFVVGMWWLRERDVTKPTLRRKEAPTGPEADSQATQEKATNKASAVADTPKTDQAPPEVNTADADDLTALNGIGPAFEQALNAIGVYTYADLAAQNATTLAEQLDARGVTAERIERDEWIEQAAARLNGDEAEV